MNNLSREQWIDMWESIKFIESKNKAKSRTKPAQKGEMYIKDTIMQREINIIKKDIQLILGQME